MMTATMVVATIPVTDLERSKTFYGETVGLTFLWETPVRGSLPMRRRERALDLQAATGDDRAHPRPFRGRRRRARGQEPRRERRRVSRLHRRSAHNDGSHRATRSGTLRLVPRSRREHARYQAGISARLLVVRLVVEPGQPGGEPLERDLELRIEIDERAQLIGDPRKRDRLFAAARLRALRCRGR